MGDILIGFNMLGIVYVIFHSIYLRRMLVRLEIKLDEKKVSPSDYSVIVRNIPLTKTKVELKEEFEQKLFDNIKNFKVECVNYCYDIEAMT